LGRERCKPIFARIKMHSLIDHIKQGDIKSLARSISIVENEAEGYEELLSSIETNQQTKIIGITGAPGVGKSTLTEALISAIINRPSWVKLRANPRVAALKSGRSRNVAIGTLLRRRSITPLTCSAMVARISAMVRSGFALNRAIASSLERGAAHRCPPTKPHW